MGVTTGCGGGKKFLITEKKNQAKPYIYLALHILDLGMEQDFEIEEVLEMPRCQWMLYLFRW